MTDSPCIETSLDSFLTSSGKNSSSLSAINKIPIMYVKRTELHLIYWQCHKDLPYLLASKQVKGDPKTDTRCYFNT